MTEFQKNIPTNLFEGITSISSILNHADINGRRIVRVMIDRTKQRTKMREIGFLKAKSTELGFPLEFVDAAYLDSVTVGKTHGGIVAECTERTLPELTETQICPNGFYVYTEGIEDPYNFGYTVRSLYAAGVNGVILPPRNWMDSAGTVARSSAGCSEAIPMFVADSEQVAEVFHKLGYQILCAGIRDSVSVFDEEFKLPILLVIGGEKRGISRSLLDQADKIVRIDYGREFRGSLSASAAAAVLAFSIFAQNREKS